MWLMTVWSLWQAGSGGVAPPAINYQGDGKRRRKRRNRTEELFRELEATLRGELVPPSVAEAEVYAVASISEPKIRQYEDELLALRRTLDTHDVLQARMASLQQQLADHAERQRIRQLQEDDDEWLYLS